MAGYMNFTLSRAPNENWVDEGGPDCFYRLNCQELFYQSCLPSNEENNKIFSEGSVTTRVILHLSIGNCCRESFSYLNTVKI